MLQRQFTRASRWITSLPSNTQQAVTSIPSGVKYTGKVLAVTPQLASFWARRAWNWRRHHSDDSYVEDFDSDWDYDLSTEAELRFNSTDGKSKIGELSVFSPETFQSLRSMFDISEESFRQSIFGSGPFVSFQSNSKGAARVGGVFFFTRDGAYMIKTIKV